MPQGNVVPRNGCRQHDRPICPLCLFNCESASPDDLPEVAQGAKLFIAHPSKLLFSWSTKRPDYQLLKILSTYPDSRTEDCIAVNAGWYPLLVPMYDEQVQGIKIRDRFRDLRFVRFKVPPSSSYSNEMHLVCTYCKICQLTWLKRVACRDYYSHPWHNTIPPREATKNSLNQRSLVVSIDGAIANGKGTDIAGRGVYFGEGSKYNYSGPICLTSARKEVADFYAIRQALAIVKDEVIPDWFENPKLHKETVSPKNLRLIIASDVKPTVEIFTTQIKKWIYVPKEGAYRNMRNDVIKDSDVIRDIELRIDALANNTPSVEVVWYHAKKNFTLGASNLAKAAY
ncbi:uncharacterized protein F4822DRAFT_441046 [Hypoxylon trugodes]|uniref:uncharacterized protein n=1 Tax=Hypoxylon trugodes TaxID=326681 RepID=UPI002192D03C|nr:uncharacterized protein F4822DRAFT_441046 [Hypoxylon trugodes]KAI1391772.1 hypothetical protein F4822DRAFT_441046 [Hypoxylon trugodes]